MTDLWDKKPEPVWVPRGYFSESKIKEDDVQMIILDDLDAWLEKLKAEVDRLNKEGLEHHAIAVEYYEKLEAVEKYCLGVLEETKDLPNWMVIVRKLMREILKILEASG